MFVIHCALAYAACAGSQEILNHDWLREGGEASDVIIEPEVLKRLKGFAAMNKLKKEALKVRGPPPPTCRALALLLGVTARCERWISAGTAEATNAAAVVFAQPPYVLSAGLRYKPRFLLVDTCVQMHGTPPSPVPAPATSCPSPLPPVLFMPFMTRLEPVLTTLACACRR